VLFPTPLSVAVSKTSWSWMEKTLLPLRHTLLEAPPLPKRPRVGSRSRRFYTMAIGPESLLSPSFTTGKGSLDHQTRLVVQSCESDFIRPLYMASLLVPYVIALICAFNTQVMSNDFPIQLYNCSNLGEEQSSIVPCSSSVFADLNFLFAIACLLIVPHQDSNKCTITVQDKRRTKRKPTRQSTSRCVN
jgi:hypothetical protein